MKNSTVHKFPGESILEGMSEIAYVYNSEGRLVMWNTDLERMIGYPSDQLYLSHYTDFIDDSFKDIVEQTAQKVFEQKSDESVEYLLITKSGEKIPFIGSGRLVEIDGDPYMVGQAINISKLKNTEKELKHRIEEINSLKDELQKENTYLRQQVFDSSKFRGVIGESEIFKQALVKVGQAITTKCTVLLEGQHGTGKDLFAHTIHQYSEAKNAPFVHVNCATFLKASNIENVFGTAKNGIIFFDSINELNPKMQASLMHYLKHEKIGNDTANQTRVISSSHEKLTDLVDKNLFRKDLYFLINALNICLPPLKERVTDIHLLTEYFIKLYNEKHGKKVSKITVSVMNQLQEYQWPGNIRELEIVIDRAVAESTGAKLVLDPLVLPQFAKPKKFVPLSEFEKKYIVKVLKSTGWRIDGPKGAALILEIHPETLRSRIRKLGIKKPKK